MEIGKNMDGAATSNTYIYISSSTYLPFLARKGGKKEKRWMTIAGLEASFFGGGRRRIEMEVLVGVMAFL